MGAELFTASLLLDIVALTLAAFYMALLIAGELQKKGGRTVSNVRELNPSARLVSESNAASAAVFSDISSAQGVIQLEIIPQLTKAA